MENNLYESDQLLNEYLLFHYGKLSEILPYDFGPSDALNFPYRCVDACLDHKILPEGARALDLGCAVGRSSFELARHCAEVVGLDYSENFIRTANFLKDKGKLPYEIKITGEICAPAVAEVSKEIDRERLIFKVADAHNLPAELSNFDVVLAANLLCRMHNPRQLIARFSDLVKPGGQIILTTPHTWMDNFTVRENWLGATPEAGHPLETIKKEMASSFSLTDRRDMPFLIREHARKFQWSVAEATLWHRL